MNLRVSYNSLSDLKINRFILFLLIPGLLFIQDCKKDEAKMLVLTGQVSGIQKNSADASGRLVSLGENAIQFGHCYSTIPGPTLADQKTTLGRPIGPTDYISHLNNLEAGTKYYIRAYISNGSGTVYGVEYNFTTIAPSLPSVTTTPVSSVTASTAASGGNITSDGGSLPLHHAEYAGVPLRVLQPQITLHLMILEREILRVSCQG